MANPALAIRVVATVAELKKALAEGKAEIVTTTAAMSKMAAAFQGDKLIQAAHNVVAAIDKVGVSALTTREAGRQLDLLERSMAKLEATSRPVPAAMVATADALRKVMAEAQPPQQGAASKWWGDFTTQVASSAAGFFTAQAALNVVSGAVHTVTGFLQDSVQSAAAAEVAQAKLTAALVQQGTATPAVIAQYAALSGTLQRTTVYSDDLTTEMQALLVQVGHLMPSQMAAAQTAAADLASGLGIDLQQATMLVAKAATGHTEALGRYGITVDEVALKNQGFTAVLEAVNAQFGGQAAAQAATYTGAVAKLANAWDNLKESVGRKLTQDPLVEAGLRALARAASDEAEALDASAAAQETWVSWAKERVVLAAKLAFAPASAVTDATVASAREAAAQANVLARAAAGVSKGYEALTLAASASAATNRLWSEGVAEASRLAQIDAEKKQAAAAAQKRLSEETARYTDTVRLVLQTSQGWVANLETIDGRLVEGARYYQARGVDLRQIGEMYGLTAVQVQALSEQFRLDNLMAQAAAGIHATLATSVEGTAQAYQQLATARARTQAPGLTGGVNPQLAAATRPFAESFGAMLQTALPQSIMSAVQGGGSVLRAAGSTVGSFLTSKEGLGKQIEGGLTKMLGSGLGGAVSALMPGIGALAGPLLEKLFSIGGPSAAEKAGRDAAAQFQRGVAAGLTDAQRAEAGGRGWAATVIGVRDAYLAVGRSAAEAEAAVQQLWAAERQGPEAVAAVQASLQGVLDQAARVRQAAGQFGPSRAELQQMARDAKATYDFMLASGQYTADQLAAAFEASQQAQARSLGLNTEAQKKQLESTSAALTELQTQRDQIWNQIAAEAPEEVMGVIEAGQRAQVASLDQQMEAQKAKMAVEAADAAATLEAALAGIEAQPVHVPVYFDYQNPPGGMGFTSPEVTPLAEGGFGTVNRPTLFLVGEAGPEQFAASGANKTFDQTGFPGGSSGDLSRLEGHLASVDRRLSQMPEMLGLALKSGLRQVGRRR